LNPSQYTSVGVTAAILTPVIMWLFQRPFAAPTEAQASAIAALLIAAGGGIHSLIQAYLAHKAEKNAPVKASTP